MTSFFKIGLSAVFVVSLIGSADAFAGRKCQDFFEDTFSDDARVRAAGAASLKNCLTKNNTKFGGRLHELALGDSSPKVQETAIRALTFVATDTIAGFLWDLATRLTGDLQLIAIESMWFVAENNERGMRDFLIERLSYDRSQAVRAAAAFGLRASSRKDQNVRTALIRALKDPRNSAHVKMSCVDGLFQAVFWQDALADPVRSTLMKVVMDSREDLTVRLKATWGLGGGNWNDSVLTFLKQVMQNRRMDSRLRDAATAAYAYEVSPSERKTYRLPRTDRRRPRRPSP